MLPMCEQSSQKLLKLKFVFQLQ